MVTMEAFSFSPLSSSIQMKMYNRCRSTSTDTTIKMNVINDDENEDKNNANDTNTEEDGKENTNAATENSAPPPCSKFPNCSGKYLSQGCNGKGKIAGGISSLPGMGWFPLKVYRPCPALIDAGYGYIREGQTFGEIVAGKANKKE